MFERIIKKVNYYIIFSLILFQLIIFTLCAIFLEFEKIYLQISNWSLILSSIYLFLVLICDTVLYFFSSKILEKLNYFTRNFFSKIAFPYCFMITIVFWGIFLLQIVFNKKTFIESLKNMSIIEILKNIHLHFGITVIMLFELFLSDRDKLEFTIGSGISNIVIFIGYVITASIAKLKFEKKVYDFIENINTWEIIGLGAGALVLLIGCFFFYNFISNLINRNYIRTKRCMESKLVKKEDENENFEYILGE